MSLKGGQELGKVSHSFASPLFLIELFTKGISHLGLLEQIELPKHASERPQSFQARRHEQSALLELAGPSLE